MNTPPTKRKRRFLRLSLRTLLVLLTVGCVWLGWKVNKAQKQRAAVAWVEENGGGVRYEYEYDFDDPTPPGPTWLRELIGIDFLSDVRGVYFDGHSRFSDVSTVPYFAGLREFSIDSTNVTDLIPLAKLESLESLSLNRTNVTDLTPISGLADLERLYLRNTLVTDLTPLIGLKKLKILHLTNTPLSTVREISGDFIGS